MIKNWIWGAAGLMLLAAGMSANGQEADDNPFHGRGDRGELVHVLPLPAAIRSQSDMQPTIAPPSSGATVYKASYGTGNLLYHRGNVMTVPAFYPIFWNSAVASATGSSLGYGTIQNQISLFAAAFLNSAQKYTPAFTDDYNIVGQYRDSANEYPVPSGSSPNWLTDGQNTQTTISDSQIQSYLATLFSRLTAPVPVSPSTIYGVYFPSGMKVTLGSSGSCSSFCGYHSSFMYGGTPIKYAVFPYPDCSGCSLSGLAVGDMFTIVSSHEIREAATDPFGSAWYDKRGYEADDKCAWHNLYQMSNGLFWVQPEYSNGGPANSVSAASYPGPGCVKP